MVSPEADLSLPPLEQARQHVARLQLIYPAAADVATWAASIAAHLEPLPADRQWRRLRAQRATMPVAQLVPRVARDLLPPAGTRPQPRCAPVCLATHAADAEQVA